MLPSARIFGRVTQNVWLAGKKRGVTGGRFGYTALATGLWDSCLRKLLVSFSMRLWLQSTMPESVHSLDIGTYSSPADEVGVILYTCLWALAVSTVYFEIPFCPRLPLALPRLAGRAGEPLPDHPQHVLTTSLPGLDPTGPAGPLSAACILKIVKTHPITPNLLFGLILSRPPPSFTHAPNPSSRN